MLQPTWLDWDSRGIADVVDLPQALMPDMPFPAALITRISVPEAFRKQGVATRLLGSIIADADDHHVHLLAEVSPSGSMSTRAIRDWLTRNGFRKTVSGYMHRPPG